MAQQKGTIAVNIGFESVFGTAPAAGFQVQVNSFGLKAQRAINAAATLTANRSPTQPFAGNKSVRGPIVIPVDSLALPYWLKAMFGAPVTTGAGPYVHEFKIGATMPSITLEVPFTDLATDKYSRFVGCKIASFAIETGGDGELVLSLDVAGANHSFENAAFCTPTAVALARLQNFQAAVTEGGSSLTNAKLVGFNVDFGLDLSQYTIGAGGVLGSIPEGIVGISGRVRTLFEDTTLLAKGAALTESGVKATWTGSASSIFELEAQELYYEWTTPEITGPQGLDVDMPFRAFYNDGSEASAIVARVTNGVASYA
ncbi:MAG: phage tail tube protein [Desulfobacterales bacterium]|jgi:hypothetical protein|nr:phage tail tube protein [Desulfobacterales bacterium]MCU0601292.1 phage tail tube protein [Desulfobacterales bacterium]